MNSTIRGPTSSRGAGLINLLNLGAADLSTPLSRAATQAPLGASFNAGTIMGPAIGGGLAALAVHRKRQLRGQPHGFLIDFLH